MEYETPTPIYGNVFVVVVVVVLLFVPTLTKILRCPVPRLGFRFPVIYFTDSTIYGTPLDSRHLLVSGWFREDVNLQCPEI